MTNQQTPERVTSAPVPVPTHTDPNDERDGFDRADAVDVTDKDRGAAEDVTDRVPDDALDDRGSFDDPALSGERNDPDDLTAVSPGAPEYQDPPPQQTAFGAATVGGAAAAAAQAGPSRDVREDDFDSTDDPDGTAALDGGRTDVDAGHDDHDVHDVHDDQDDLDPDRGTLDGDRHVGDRTAFDAEPAVVDSHPAEEPMDGHRELPETAPAVDTPAPAAAEEPIAGLWGEQTVQGFRDRWREVQLRFVDDPPAAAREANQLVEEAVGAFTAELSRQKEQLRDWSGEDTEDLRAVVRRHRDFLDRLLGL